MHLRRAASWGLCLAVLALLSTAGSGCSSTKPGTGRTPGLKTEAIVEINMLTAPSALNFDGVPGPDGISLRIYAGNPRLPKCLPITAGTLEILLFDGLLQAGEVKSAQPLIVWSYPADELPRFARKSSIGVSYVFTPRWGPHRPKRNRATAVARYLPPDGASISSAPAAMFVGQN
jgi:hypothetical protein